MVFKLKPNVTTDMLEEIGWKINTYGVHAHKKSSERKNAMQLVIFFDSSMFKNLVVYNNCSDSPVKEVHIKDLIEHNYVEVIQ